MKRTVALILTMVMTFVISFSGVSASDEAERDSYGGKPDVTIAITPFPGDMIQSESNNHDGLSLEEYIADGYKEVDTPSVLDTLNSQYNEPIKYNIVYSDNEVSKYQIVVTNGTARFLTGWVKDGDYWLYYDNYGNKITGWYKIDGLWYYFDLVYGHMLTGWQQISYEWYYFNPNGSMKHGWIYTGDQTSFYYMGVPGDPDTGAMYTNGWLHDITGKWYYIESDGRMVIGWKTIGGKTYYLLDSGVIDTSGEMVTGTHTVDGVTYMFDSKGVRINSAPPSNVSNRSLYVLFCNDLVGRDDNLNAVHNIQSSMKGMGYTDCTYLAMPYYPYKAYAQLPYSKVAVLHGHGNPGVSYYQDPSALHQNDNHMLSSRTLRDGSTYSSYGYWPDLNITVGQDDYFIEDYLPGQLNNLDFVCMISCYSARKQLLDDSTKYINESMAEAIHNKGAKAVMAYYYPVAGGEFYADCLFDYLGNGQDIVTAINNANKEYAQNHGLSYDVYKNPISPHDVRNQRLVGDGTIVLHDISSHSVQESNRIYHSAVTDYHSMEYVGTKQVNMSGLYKVVNNVDAVFSTDFFVKNGIEYGYNEAGQLVSIDTGREYVTESSGNVTDEMMVQSLKTQLNGWLSNVDDYQVSAVTESIIGYQVVMENEAGDNILAAFDMAGNLSWVTLYYKNPFVPTEEQLSSYQSGLNEYLSSITESYADYTAIPEYMSAQGKTFAIYTIYFEGKNGSVWTDQIAVG